MGFIMQYEDAKSYLREKLGDYIVKNHQVELGRGNFRCLFPENHKNGDRNPSMEYRSRKHTVFCYACGVEYDIFSLIQSDYGYTSFRDAFQKACDIYGIEARSKVKKDSEYLKILAEKRSEKTFRSNDSTRQYRESKARRVLPDQTAYYRKCMQNRKVSQKALNYLHSRGLSDKTLDRFWIGYDPSWHHPYTKNKNTQRIIIPNNKAGYLARVLDDTIELGKYDHKKSKAGAQGCFNLKAIAPGKTIFVVEGEIDCMSIEEIGFPCVGLGSATQYRKLVSFCEKNPQLVQNAFFLIGLDNDEAGERAAKKLSDELIARKIPCGRYSVSGSFKDPNEFLQMDRSLMESSLKALYAKYEEIRRNTPIDLIRNQ